MYLGGGGGCTATFSVTLTPHSTEKAQKKSPWNYFTFVCAPLHLQLTGREKKWATAGKLSSSKMCLETDLNKVGFLDWKNPPPQYSESNEVN